MANKTVAMIDANSMIDRRIILEAELLKKNGFDVYLCCKEERTASSYNNDAGAPIPIFRFPEMDVSWTRFYKSFDFFGKFLPYKVNTLLVCFLHPRAGRIRLEESALPPVIKGLILGLFTVIYPWIKKPAPGAVSYWENLVINFIKSKNPDVIHAHDLPALRAGVILKQALKCPLVYDAHEIYPFQPGYDAITKDKLYRAEKELLPNADMVIVINQDQAEFMMGEYGKFDYAVLTNATSYPLKYVKGNQYNLIRDKLGLGADAKIILFQGGVNRLRKIDCLIEGVSMSSENVHLALMTWGGEIEEFKKMASSLGVENRVHFIDPVPWEEVLFWAASADIGFLPYQAHDLNTKISSPNKMYEFILSHTPMIASKDLVNVKRVFEQDNVGLLWDLKVPKDYAAAITQMLADQPKYDSYKQNLKTCSDKYTWDYLSNDFQRKYVNLAH